MKKVLIFAAAILQLSAFAADYSKMSIEEMNQMRGTLKAEERAQFQKAYQEKLQQLPVEERSKYMGKTENASGQGQGAGGKMRGGGRGRM